MTKEAEPGAAEPTAKRGVCALTFAIMRTILKFAIVAAFVGWGCVALLRAQAHAPSHQILLAADAGRFEFALSVPLLAEYDDVTRRSNSGIDLPPAAVEAIIGRLAAICHRQQIYFLWRPLLQAPKDDMVLEVAIASGASHIITFNRKDLEPASQFGIVVVTPSQFLTLLA